MILPLINPCNPPRPSRPHYRMASAKSIYGPKAGGSILYRGAMPVLHESTPAVRKVYRALMRKNPLRPPKAWFYKTLAKVQKSGKYRDPARIVGHIWHHVASKSAKSRLLRKHENPSLKKSRIVIVSPGRELGKYLKLHRAGYRTLWAGEGKIALQAPKKSPALSRGTYNPFSKESRMAVFSLVPRRRRAIRRRRHNPRFGAHRPVLRYTRGGWRRGRRSRLMTRAVTLRNPRFGSHRPVMLYTPTGWKRSRRSRLLRYHQRINPRRYRRRHNEPNPRRYRRYFRRRRNPLPFKLDKVFIGGAKIAAGITIGFIGMPVLVKFMPAAVTAKYRRFYGFLHVALGAVVAAFVKNRHVKDAALIVAGTGVYDLIASNVTMLGLPTLPDTSTLLPRIGLKGDEPGVVGMGASYQQIGADYAPAFGASYQQVGRDDIAYGGDDDDNMLEIG